MKTVAACLILIAAGPCAASAQEPTPPVVLSLEEALTRGLASSHRLVEATARRDGAAAAVDGRRSAAKPQVAAVAGYTRTNHVEEFGIPLPNNQLRVIYPDLPNNYRARLDVQWPLYTGGRVEALTEAARRESVAAADDIDTLRADLRLDISRAFWALVVADESLHVVNESLTRVAAQLRDVRSQLEAGLVPPNEVLTVQAQESRQRMLSIQARLARDVAEADLARVIGAAPGTRIQTSATLTPPAVQEEMNALLTRARAQRADRQALLDRLAAARSRELAAASGRRPNVALSGGLDYARPNPRIFPRQANWMESWDAGVHVSWPLFDGGRSRAETAETSAARRAIEARIEELDSVMALEVRQRLAEIESSRAAVAAAEDALRAATEARRVVADRFDAGVATSTQVLDAQMAVLQASLDRTQALAGGRLAEARLQRALGQ